MSGRGKSANKPSVSSDEQDSVSDRLLLDALLKIQVSLSENNNILTQTLNQLGQKVDAVSAKHDELSKSVNGTDGVIASVNELQESVGSNTDVIEHLRKENQQLRHELEVMKNIVIQTAHRVERNEEKISNLSVHSMKNNILIHGVVEEEGQDLFKKVPELLNEKFQVNISFSALHRMGNTTQPSQTKAGVKQKDPKPRIIVGKLSNPEQKSAILKAAAQVQDPNIRVTSQYPEDYRDKRARLYKVRDDFKEKEVDCDVRGDKLVFKDKGRVFREKVGIPTPEDILNAASDSTMRKKLDKIDSTTGDIFKDKGNVIVSQACIVETFANVKNFALKVLADESSMSADSNVIVYRFTDNKGDIHEGWSNDREYGAGQGILNIMQDNNVMNIAVIMSRKVGQHLGVRRHSVFQGNAMSAINLLLGES